MEVISATKSRGFVSHLSKTWCKTHKVISVHAIRSQLPKSWKSIRLDAKWLLYDDFDHKVLSLGEVEFISVSTIWSFSRIHDWTYPAFHVLNVSKLSTLPLLYLQSTRKTRSSSIVKLARPSVPSSLQITNRALLDMHHLTCVISSVLHPVHSPPGSPHLIKCITSSVPICQTRDLQNARATLYALVSLNRRRAQHGTDADSKMAWHGPLVYACIIMSCATSNLEMSPCVPLTCSFSSHVSSDTKACSRNRCCATFWLAAILADRTNGRAIATLLRLSSVCLSVTLCIVAKWCVVEQKLLLRAYRKSYMRNRLVPKWMTLTFV